MSAILSLIARFVSSKELPAYVVGCRVRVPRPRRPSSPSMVNASRAVTHEALSLGMMLPRLLSFCFPHKLVLQARPTRARRDELRRHGHGQRAETRRSRCCCSLDILSLTMIQRHIEQCPRLPDASLPCSPCRVRRATSTRRVSSKGDGNGDDAELDAGRPVALGVAHPLHSAAVPRADNASFRRCSSSRRRGRGRGGWG